MTAGSRTLRGPTGSYRGRIALPQGTVLLRGIKTPRRDAGHNGGSPLLGVCTDYPPEPLANPVHQFIEMAVRTLLAVVNRITLLEATQSPGPSPPATS